jgi:hypothetical protein
LRPRIRSSNCTIDAPNSAQRSPFYNNGGTANYINFLDVIPNQPFVETGYNLFYLFKAYEPENDPNTLVISQFGVSWGLHSSVRGKPMKHNIVWTIVTLALLGAGT